MDCPGRILNRRSAPFQSPSKTIVWRSTTTKLAFRIQPSLDVELTPSERTLREERQAEPRAEQRECYDPRLAHHDEVEVLIMLCVAGLTGARPAKAGLT